MTFYSIPKSLGEKPKMIEILHPVEMDTTAMDNIARLRNLIYESMGYYRVKKATKEVAQDAV